MTRVKIWIAGAVCFPIAIAMAQPAQPEYAEAPIFRANEASLDLFGSVSLGRDSIEDISGDKVCDDGRLGAGIGLNYFFTRYLGLGGDAYTESTKGTFVDNASGNLIIRIPIETIRLAPYVYGGGGRQFDSNDRWFGQAGAGIEVRFTPNFGLFTDARYVFPDEAGNFGVGRLGLRFAF